MADIPEYIKLSKQRSLFKQRLNGIIGRDLQSLLKEFERYIEKVFQESGNTLQLTSADFKDIVNRFLKELTNKSEFRLKVSRDELIGLHEQIKKALDFNYPIDYQLFPKVTQPTEPLLREVTAILTNYRQGKLTEQNTQRLIKKRFRVPIYHADSFINTQLAAFDNTTALEIANLAGLKRAQYFGPIGKNTREFCLKLLGKGGTYAEKEIRAMDNGQGLPVIRYCGGYRCMHEWLWIDPEWDV